MRFSLKFNVVFDVIIFTELQVTCRNSTFFIDKISYKAYSAKIPNNNIFKKNFKIKPGSIMALAKITKYPDIFKI